MCLGGGGQNCVGNKCTTDKHIPRHPDLLDAKQSRPPTTPTSVCPTGSGWDRAKQQCIVDHVETAKDTSTSRTASASNMCMMMRGLPARQSATVKGKCVGEMAKPQRPGALSSLPANVATKRQRLNNDDSRNFFLSSLKKQMDFDKDLLLREEGLQPQSTLRWHGEHLTIQGVP